ncbi:MULTISPECIES: DUF308 domain-containing protein [Spirosoma]|uniref:DUF308 domain-containing protein n=1 Tax=Spirosoma liriopis TaxID=2937440 RepID=A0ABT0HHL0_9BACT|nr:MULTISPECIES: DUF308 domain-containing protein [Spirosoma]MCK8491656.1 DUF308 domain-containing protein [Spirosoma liriopis]UHG91017.1 DUF308 domain-containing protein [Spirosoma oryzicola]
MVHPNQSPRWWLLLARGVLYLAIGVFLLVSANGYSEQLGHIVGALVVLAGISQLVFSLTNHAPESTNLWGILHGVADLGFGVAIYINSNEAIRGFVDMLGFWGMMYAFLQAVQAMYAAIAARGASGVHLSTMIVHFVNVLVAGGLCYVLLFSQASSNGSLGLAGLFPAVLGALIIVLTQQMKTQADNSQHSHRMS